jgi:sulfopyruvate decarboxylase subunit alpha
MEEAMARSHLVVEAMQKCGVTHVVWLPDSESRFMYDALSATPAVKLVPVCREGEAFGIAAGLQLGGKTPVVLIQNTGLFESGDVLRGTFLNMQLPLLLMVGYRGYHEMVTKQGPLDSAAVFTEPILNAWGITHYLVDTDDDVDKIAKAFQESRDKQCPVAILIGREYDA